MEFDSLKFNTDLTNAFLYETKESFVRFDNNFLRVLKKKVGLSPSEKKLFYLLY